MPILELQPLQSYPDQKQESLTTNKNIKTLKKVNIQE